jgi:hypothetical protein
MTCIYRSTPKGCPAINHCINTWFIALVGFTFWFTSPIVVLSATIQKIESQHYSASEVAQYYNTNDIPVYDAGVYDVSNQTTSPTPASYLENFQGSMPYLRDGLQDYSGTSIVKDPAYNVAQTNVLFQDQQTTDGFRMGLQSHMLLASTAPVADYQTFNTTSLHTYQFKVDETYSYHFDLNASVIINSTFLENGPIGGTVDLRLGRNVDLFEIVDVNNTITTNLLHSFNPLTWVQVNTTTSSLTLNDAITGNNSRATFELQQDREYLLRITTSIDGFVDNGPVGSLMSSSLVTVSAVPEPSSVASISLAIAALGFRRSAWTKTFFRRFAKR